LRHSGFAGFPPDALRFLRDLAANNKREWFQPRKYEYEAVVRAPMLELVGAVNHALARFAPDYITEPDKAIYRIYRDTRFSPDKTPYKTHIAAVFKRRGLDKHSGAGLYFSVSPAEIEVAGGLYMPGPEQLLAVRRYITAHHEQFKSLISHRGLRRQMGELKGESLSRSPKGFDPEHPAAAFVRMKQWLFWTMLDPALAATDRLYEEIVKRFQLMTPFIEFLNRSFAQRYSVARQ
jgi:uncharacterized protein (TIGR02453 family)